MLRKLFVIFFLLAFSHVGFIQAAASQSNNHIADGDMGGGGDWGGGGDGGGWIDIDFGGGGGDTWDIPSYEPEYEPQWEPQYEPEYEPQWEPQYEQPKEYINIYEPEPTYTAPPQPQPQPQPAPRPRVTSLPLIVIVNLTPVVRIGQIITIRIQVNTGRQPVDIFWRIDGLAGWINGGDLFRRRATRPGVIPITVVVRDADGIYSQRQTTYVTVLKNASKTTRPPSTAPAKPQSNIANQQMQLNAQAKAIAGCYDTDFGILRLSTNDGVNVTGTYEYLGGSTITGSLKDNILIGTWSEPALSGNPAMTGPFQFAFTENWKSFQGVWGNYGDEPLTGIWNGTRVNCPPAGQVSPYVSELKKETMNQQQTNIMEGDQSDIPDLEHYDKNQGQGQVLQELPK